MALPALIGPLLGLGETLIKRWFPDPEQQAKARADLVRLQQDGNLKELEVQMSAIVAEAQSEDPYTSRARPTFLYVVYIYILAAIPMGVLFAIHPATAQAVTSGVNGWLASIPEPIVWLFGTGYLGYTGARSLDKRGFMKLTK